MIPSKVKHDTLQNLSQTMMKKLSDMILLRRILMKSWSQQLSAPNQNGHFDYRRESSLSTSRTVFPFPTFILRFVILTDWRSTAQVLSSTSENVLLPVKILSLHTLRLDLRKS